MTGRRLRRLARSACALGLATTMVVGPAAGGAAPPRGTERAARRIADDSELATVVGGGGTPVITFGSDLSASSNDNATIAYNLSAPADPAGRGIFASFRVEDAAVSGSPGTWQVSVIRTVDSVVIASAGPSPDPTQPTLLQDVSLDPSTSYTVNVTEVAGTTPRSFRLRMSPRYTVPTGTVSFGGSVASTLVGGGYDTYALTLAAPTPNAPGATDLFLHDIGIATGSNTVTVIAPDRVVKLASFTTAGDVAADGSGGGATGGFTFSTAGTYLVVVNNTDTTATGDYQLDVGPTPPACQAMPAPSFTTASNVPPPNDEDNPLVPPQINSVVDRDCFSFSEPKGVSQVKIAFDQTNAPDAALNEIRLFRNGTLIGSKVATGDFTYAPIFEDTGAATYWIEVNNQGSGLPVYGLNVALGGVCLASSFASCQLSPDLAVGDTITSTHTTATFAVAADQSGSTLPTNAAASFYFDRQSGSGNMTVKLMNEAAQTLCSATGSGDLFLENCNLTTTSGHPSVNVTRGSTATGDFVLRMGPNLRPQCDAPTPITLASTSNVGITQASLDVFGEEDYYMFSLPQPAPVGIGFNDLGISTGKNLVSIYRLSDCDTVARTANPTALLQYSGTGDGGAAPTLLDAGNYLLVVDNDKLGTGSYAVCVGPGADPQDEDYSAPRVIDLSPLTPTFDVTESGQLTCADTDEWDITSPAQHATSIRVQEIGGGNSDTSGSISAKLIDPSGATVAQGSGSGAVTLSVTVNPTTTTPYRLIIDNTTYGHYTYDIDISATS